MRTGPTISRRDFLKLGALSAAGLAFERLPALRSPETNLAPGAICLLRVGTSEVPVFQEPDYESDQVGVRVKDELIFAYQEITSPEGPQHNPRWYQIEEGYVHSAHLQRVESQTNPIQYSLSEERQLGEVTVPITLSFLNHKRLGWSPLYRLYYQSVHWITEVGYGPQGLPCYGIRDDLLPITYFVPAHHIRLIPFRELTPLSPEVPPERKKLLVNRTHQTVTAIEDGEQVFHTYVSTGEPYNKVGSTGPSTITPLGEFNINIKMPVRHMGDGQVTNDPLAYELPGIPWVSYFYKTGVAFHGCYWHDNYGTEMSHGCVNMRPEEAKWIFRWATPVTGPRDRVSQGYGTRVEVVV